MTDTSTNALFIITSATNAPYAGAFAGDAHQQQTGKSTGNDHAHGNNQQPAATGQSVPGYDSLLATISSINTHAPGSRIALVEYSAYPLSQPQHDALIEQVDYLMSYAGNEQIQRFDRELGSHQAIAAFSELTSLLWFLQVGQHHDLYKPFKRVFKMSPGVQLVSAPADSAHFADSAQGRYVFPNAILAPNAAGALALQFSNGYWSMDTSLVPSFIALLQEILEAMHKQDQQGQAVSVESMLYKYIDAGKIFYDLKPVVADASSK
ncbi:hypothetical protein [Advenella mimigardefordensis]|uniref:Uncharacterized protein n=1 Tax=Advenella mimigardefordensis (strain DSM 17166 / LMG 22922 / DPN7) TaxID=1247726 RepID=W0PFT8_ADVMD|nr:hypothetical protein [Advenella mimigardefordensis]AHG64367.1 hypothetical protein MIM_c22920 [Advenella mimigardefordensis DPN7]